MSHLKGQSKRMRSDTLNTMHFLFMRVGDISSENPCFSPMYCANNHIDYSEKQMTVLTTPKDISCSNSSTVQQRFLGGHLSFSLFRALKGLKPCTEALKCYKFRAFKHVGLSNML